MTSFEKLYRKYAGSPIRPPADSKKEDEDIYDSVLQFKARPQVEGPEKESIELAKALRPQNLSPFFQSHVLEEGEDALDPEKLPFFAEYEEKEADPDFLEEARRQHKELGDRPYRDLAPEESTVPPGPKKANPSPDTLLKMCSQYHDLCRKF